LVVAASGFNGLAAIGQSSASSLPIDALSDRHPINSDRYGLAGDANLVEERDLPNDAPPYPTIAQLGLQHTGSLKQADSLTVSNLTQKQQGATVVYDNRCASAIAARESSGDTSAAGGVLNGSRAKDLKMQNEFQRNSDCEDGTIRQSHAG
jgi:hypothetical protein